MGSYQDTYKLFVEIFTKADSRAADQATNRAVSNYTKITALTARLFHIRTTVNQIQSAFRDIGKGNELLAAQFDSIGNALERAVVGGSAFTYVLQSLGVEGPWGMIAAGAMAAITYVVTYEKTVAEAIDKQIRKYEQAQRAAENYFKTVGDQATEEAKLLRALEAYMSIYTKSGRNAAETFREIIKSSRDLNEAQERYNRTMEKLDLEKVLAATKKLPVFQKLWWEALEETDKKVKQEAGTQMMAIGIYEETTTVVHDLAKAEEVYIQKLKEALGIEKEYSEDDSFERAVEARGRAMEQMYGKGKKSDDQISLRAQIVKNYGNDELAFELDLQQKITALLRKGAYTREEIEEYERSERYKHQKELNDKRIAAERNAQKKILEMRGDEVALFKMNLEDEIKALREAGASEKLILEYRKTAWEDFEKKRTEASKREAERRREEEERIKSQIRDFYIELYQLRGQDQKALELQLEKELKAYEELGIKEEDLAEYKNLKLTQKQKQYTEHVKDEIEKLTKTTLEYTIIELAKQVDEWRKAGVEEALIVKYTQEKIRQEIKKTTENVKREIEVRIEEIKRLGEVEKEEVRSVAQARKDAYAELLGLESDELHKKLLNLEIERRRNVENLKDRETASKIFYNKLDKFIEEHNKKERKLLEDDLKKREEINKKMQSRLQELTLSSFALKIKKLSEELNAYVKQGGDIVLAQRIESEEINKIKEEETKKWIETERKKYQEAVNIQKAIEDFLEERSGKKKTKGQKLVEQEVSDTMSVINKILDSSALSIEEKFSIIEKKIIPAMNLKHLVGPNAVIAPKWLEEAKKEVQENWNIIKSIYKNKPEYNVPELITEKQKEPYKPDIWDKLTIMREWAKVKKNLDKGYEKIDSWVYERISDIDKEIANQILNDETIKEIEKKVTDAVEEIKNAIDWEKIGIDIGSLIGNGIQDGIKKSVPIIPSPEPPIRLLGAAGGGSTLGTDFYKKANDILEKNTRNTVSSFNTLKTLTKTAELLYTVQDLLDQRNKKEYQKLYAGAKVLPSFRDLGLYNVLHESFAETYTPSLFATAALQEALAQVRNKEPETEFPLPYTVPKKEYIEPFPGDPRMLGRPGNLQNYNFKVVVKIGDKEIEGVVEKVIRENIGARNV